jgi:hypothetical protein
MSTTACAPAYAAGVGVEGPWKNGACHVNPCNANESAMNKLMAHAGTLRDMGDRFVRAWKRAWTGEVFEEWHVTFFTSEELTAAFTPKRREMRRRRHGNVRKAKRSDTGYDRDLAVRVRYTAHSNTLSRANHGVPRRGVAARQTGRHFRPGFRRRLSPRRLAWVESQGVGPMWT